MLDCTFNFPIFVIDDNTTGAYKRYEINTEIFRAIDVEPPSKYVNRELNSQIGIRSQDSYFSESDGALPTSMLLWGAAYCVRYVKHDANDSLCTTWFVVVAGCGTAVLAVTSQIRTDTTQYVIHIKIYILAQLYHKQQHRLIYVHIPHIYKVLK